MVKKAIVTGCTGQDGSYLAELLINKGYEVHGIVRRLSTPNTCNISHIEGLIVHEGDITDLSSVIRLLKGIQPDEIYNLAAQSFVGVSWGQPILTSNVTGMGALNVFEAARQVCPKARIYQASSSEMFSGEEYPQSEDTVFRPKSPYGVSKLFAHEMARIYRESYGMFISCGILFNHESPRRGIEFVTQKIVDTAVRQCIYGEEIELDLGNLEAKRDWSHAKDMVRGMYMMLQHVKPDDFVMASGKTYSVREFVYKTYGILGIDIDWNEYEIAEKVLPFATGVVSGRRRVLVKSVPRFYRPNEVITLLGNPTRAKIILGWEPEYSFDDLIKDMVDNKINALK